MIAFYENKPSILESVGNGSYLYRWNIKEIPFGNDSTQWQCQEVIVWQPLTSNRITEKVINELWNNNYEQKLINEYNAAIMGIGKEAAIDAYKKFLLERMNIKEEINNICNENNILQK